MPTPAQTLATKLYAKIESKFGKLPKPARAAFQKFCEAIAEGIVEYLGADAQMSVRITVSQGGLQTVAGVPTGAPPSPVTLTGQVTQTQ